jgi:hypothetical protein
MSLYWIFDLHSLANSIVYLDRFETANTVKEVFAALQAHRTENGKRGRIGWQQLPS